MKRLATTASTTRCGSRVSNWPAVTAIAMCTVKAAAAPAQTHDGRNRVPITSEANIDLSGNSARNVIANARPITATSCIQTSLDRVFRPKSETSAGSAQQPKVSSTTSPRPGGRALTRRYVGLPTRDYSPSEWDNKETPILLSEPAVASVTPSRHLQEWVHDG